MEVLRRAMEGANMNTVVSSLCDTVVICNRCVLNLFSLCLAYSYEFYSRVPSITGVANTDEHSSYSVFSVSSGGSQMWGLDILPPAPVQIDSQIYTRGLWKGQKSLSLRLCSDLATREIYDPLKMRPKSLRNLASVREQQRCVPPPRLYPSPRNPPFIFHHLGAIHKWRRVSLTLSIPGQ